MQKLKLAGTTVHYIIIYAASCMWNECQNIQNFLLIKLHVGQNI